MKCQMTICIYQVDDRCILEEIKINGLGMCDACTLIDMDENSLAQKKVTLLAALESRKASSTISVISY